MVGFYKEQLFKPNLLSLFINPFYFIRKGLFKHISEMAPSLYGDIMDFGCGSKPYESLFTNGRSYVGVDIDDRGHPHANEMIDIHYDGITVPIPDESKDAIFTSEVFEHVDNLSVIIEELHRILKPNGKILVTVPFVFMEHEMPYDFRRFSINGLTYFLQNSGFDILEVRKSTKDIETLTQCLNVYTYSLFMHQHKLLKLVLNVIFIAPFTIVGFILSFILPNKGYFYQNAIILAKKK